MAWYLVHTKIMYEDAQLSRAQISRAAIQRLHISMRHLFIRGGYKPLGVSGEMMIESMLALQPEIYGDIAHEERVELKGLLYIFQRLPQGIEQCRYVKLITKEGYEQSGFKPLVPAKRRRNCYRIDGDTMYIEMTRGRSDIYDVLTHLTFMHIESEKIRRNALTHRKVTNRAWDQLAKTVRDIEDGEPIDQNVGFAYLSTILGRSYDEVKYSCHKFNDADKVNDLFTIAYHLGRMSIAEYVDDIDREILFSSLLREHLGSHMYGEAWADRIKGKLASRGLLSKPIHIISANMHSIMNSLYASKAIGGKLKMDKIVDIAAVLSDDDNAGLRDQVVDFAEKYGMTYILDESGTNIDVQVFDLSVHPVDHLRRDVVIIVMDYAFGEQAYETMDELLKPYKSGAGKHYLQIESVNIMGKAGILPGEKGDIMIPTAHIFEGSADNYPVDNDLSEKDFKNSGIPVYEGPMVTVLGTSLQNRDILSYFSQSSWSAVGLEMEGAHYQKAIQAAARIRKSVPETLKVRYAYYASDNPLQTGSTLASGSLGLDGVKPTYEITGTILDKIMSDDT